MAKRNFKEASRVDWTPSDKGDHEYPGHERVMIGCLQRIADATEAMAGPYLKTVADRDTYERWYREANAKIAKRDKKIAALRGVITRMKNKQLNAKEL